MKTIYLLLFFMTILSGPALHAQDIIQVDQGENYKQTVFLDLKTLEQTTVDFTEWDIAFATGPRSVGALVNEGTINGSDGAVKLFSTSAADFSDVDTTQIIQELFNAETAWEDGAFNSAKDPEDPFDFGWGQYDMNTHLVNGTRIFVIQLRDQTFKKLKIDLYNSEQYVFTYADLDGENQVTDSITIGDFSGKTLAYYSLRDQKVLDLEPDDWDLQFTRYNTPVEEEPGKYLDYLVTGVLTNTGTEVAHATKIDPSSVKYDEYQDDLNSDIDAVGYEWKYFDLGSFQYSVPDDEVYFVKTAQNEVYKIQFLDFEGASTGVTTLRITLAEVLTALKPELSYIQDSKIYPNPANGGNIYLEFDSKESRSQASIFIYNMSGAEIYRSSARILQGTNKVAVDFRAQPGMYLVRLQTAEGHLTLPVIYQ